MVPSYPCGPHPNQNKPEGDGDVTRCTVRIPNWHPPQVPQCLTVLLQLLLPLPLSNVDRTRTGLANLGVCVRLQLSVCCSCCFFFDYGFHLSVLLCCRVNCPFGRESSRCIGGHETSEIIRAMCKADEQGRWAVTELSNTSERCASTGQPWANQCDLMRCTMERPFFPEQ